MSKKPYQFIKNSLLVAFISLAFSCANIVAPTGGPKDMTPPVVKKCEPLNYSANFTGKKIRITFDEYVVLEDQVNQIVVSPPTDEEAKFNISGKSIVIDLPEKLSDSVTYSIYFGESVKDLNEGNPLSGYEFVFSKSNIVDSLSIQGYVYDALTREAQKSILVMLYTSDDDSVPIKSRPLYMTKTNAAGKFLLKNIRKDKYKIFALSDMNADMMFNQPTESIAFADSMITSQYVSTKPDTASKKDDSTFVNQDSLLQKEVIRNTILYLYTQQDTNQQLLKARADTYRQFKLIFKNHVRDLNVSVTNKQLPENWKIDEYSSGRDTLTCWLSDPDLDTLKLIITDKGIIVDTAEIALKQKSDVQKPGKRPSGKGFADTDEWKKLGISSNASGSTLFPYYLPVRLKLSNPIAKTDFSKIVLEEKIDSVFKEIKPDAILPDANVKRIFNINYKWETEKKYRLLVLPGAFTDIYGLVNDSLLVNFSADSPENYGRLLFTMKQNESSKSYLVQLLKEDKSIVEQRPDKLNQQILFENLSPADYRIRIVQDENNNGKWDGGDYFQGRQPESVFYFPQIINIRANWDTEYEFVL